eukprot:scaffold11445_cov113-Skeletonema_dohrnii-CCMP3373.AAC.2
MRDVLSMAVSKSWTSPERQGASVLTDAITTLNQVRRFRELVSLCIRVKGPRSVPQETCSKDVIDAADKFSIIILKLEAEGDYLKSTKITLVKML